MAGRTRREGGGEGGARREEGKAFLLVSIRSFFISPFFLIKIINSF